MTILELLETHQHLPIRFRSQSDTELVSAQLRVDEIEGLFWIIGEG